MLTVISEQSENDTVMFTLKKYLEVPCLSRTAKLLLAAVAGLSVSIIAGYLLSRHRRRYRAVTSTSSDYTPLIRKDTFQDRGGRTPFHGYSGAGTPHHGLLPKHSATESPTPLPDNDEGSDTDMFMDSIDQPLSGQGVEGGCRDCASDSSEDSFHSTVDTFELSSLDRNRLYVLAWEQVEQGLIHCRTIRTNTLACSSDGDFLAKLYCIRLAFNELLSSQANKDYMKQVARDVMASFLKDASEDPALFCERFDDLAEFLEREGAWRIANKELSDRRVVCMNAYDIALDFVLLDAFDDLDHPPSTIVAVLQNRWITDGMKKAALSAAVWSLLKAKRSLLQNKDGFMSRFYLLSETLTPVLAWGFLGTDAQLRQQCMLFRGKVLLFLQTLFCTDGVRYTTVRMLADDLLHLTQRTMEPLLMN